MKIGIATTTRADWGLLSPLATELRRRGAEVMVLAGAMHYDESMGCTWREIVADGFEPVLAVPASGNTAHVAAVCLERYDEALQRLSPDCLICLGDRYEMLAIALAASLQRIPIVHIAGGAISEGAFDDAFRHAITKLSSLHLTETEEYRARVIGMGENPATVVSTGAIGVYNILNIEPLPQKEIEEFVGMSLGSGTLLCTMHAATMSQLEPVQQVSELLKALERFPELRIIFTHPNNDVDPAPLIALLHDFEARHPERVRVIPSLGRVRFLSALRYVDAVIGNSSGGIVEVPSMGIPTLDIGIRQRGRTAADSVLHCGETACEIEEGIRRILSHDFRDKARHTVNPYGSADTLSLMCDTILNTDFSTLLPKKFYP